MKNMDKVKLAAITSALTAVLIAMSVGSNAASATPIAFEDGAAIYAAKCAKCHGADGKGVEKYKKQGIEDFTDAKFQKNHTDAKIAAAINNGKGDFMPARKGKLKPAEVTAVVKHIRGMKK